ncbi:hypothetical protein LTR10_008050 [Elasticomyces elasticus]|nr:hypothetical protein LTR10_008050 [Elasticomyces elasticus]KAK4971048.1 hypothetical protein LTR42_008027 [Elasticomyces elasticus]
MFSFFLAKLGFMLMAIYVCSACVFDEVTTNSTNTTRLIPRYYSVPNQRDSGTLYGPWPFTVIDDVNGNQAPIYYCYEGAWAVDNLPLLFADAFAKWGAAFGFSALRFQQDPFCGDVVECECAIGNTRDDTLRIGAVRTGISHASLGYNYQSNEPGRHILNLNVVGYSPFDLASRPVYVLIAAHELGHVIGLGHEHQRPDRDSDIDFHCENLVGYAEALAKVVDSRQSWSLPRKLPACDLPKWLTDEECMQNVVCKIGDYALNWFPEALNFITGDQNPVWKDLEWPTWALDTYSIMIYNSYDGTSCPNNGIGANFPDGAVLVGKQRGSGAIFEIFQGGTSNKAKAISSGRDKGRVGQLYPLGIRYGRA